MDLVVSEMAKYSFDGPLKYTEAYCSPMVDAVLCTAPRLV